MLKVDLKFWETNGDSLGTAMPFATIFDGIAKGQTNPTQGDPAVGVIEDFDNPISPLVIEQIPFP